MKKTGMGRRGRLPKAERAAREQDVLQAAVSELQKQGYEQLTMLSVAKRANCSKQTLYSWFGSKEGLLTALIEKNADESLLRLEAAFAADHQPSTVLTDFCVGLIKLLTSPQSIALNRAAMQSTELAEILLYSGRYRVGPVVEQYIRKLIKEGVIQKTDVKRAFTTLYGLAISDTQIRVLLGEPAPTARGINAQAQRAVSEFMMIMRPDVNFKRRSAQ